MYSSDGRFRRPREGYFGVYFPSFPSFKFYALKLPWATISSYFSEIRPVYNQNKRKHSVIRVHDILEMLYTDAISDVTQGHCAIWDIRPNRLLNPNVAKSSLPITHASVK